MKLLSSALLAAALAFAAAPTFAQEVPGKADVARVTAGTYKVDPNHTQVAWSVDHFGFSTLFGLFGQPTGSLTIDPKEPAKATVEVTFPISGLSVTSDKFASHLAGGDFFDAEKFPSARFKSRSVTVSGEKAVIEGDLTVRGVTKPVRLDASFHGAGVNPMNKAETVGFSATTKIKRSDFGLGAYVPAVSDEVTVTIVAAFEK
ncbi:YceI family protein [Methylopila turkensis]|uniref:Polyisoprenoid-binding protein n=1 Tax=Methylopila turkensis TaxID=1437816 RepID=A0A9W6N5G4_9HYPH|nr:YceI family protein [Methylopila turkensis]GLK78415.1 polyisoprenoid-binding protein [Methylopila turkensis]